MNITQLEQLIEIAKRKTLSAAAESLHISQPALADPCKTGKRFRHNFIRSNKKQHSAK